LAPDFNIHCPDFGSPENLLQSITRFSAHQPDFQLPPVSPNSVLNPQNTHFPTQNPQTTSHTPKTAAKTRKSVQMFI
jgi:hypothetical protein